MGLNKQQRITFSTKRILGRVLCENVPQITIQLWYLSRNDIDMISLLSIIFSFASIIITILTLCTQKKIIQHQQITRINFDVRSNDIYHALCRKTNAIKNDIASRLGISAHLIEILQPKPRNIITFSFEINLYGSNIDLKSIQKSVRKRMLSDIIQEKWELNKYVRVLNLVIENDTSEVELVAHLKTNQKYRHERIPTSSFKQ
eukprot:362385_1